MSYEEDLPEYKKCNCSDLFDRILFQRTILSIDGSGNLRNDHQGPLFYPNHWTDTLLDTESYLGISLGSAIHGSFVGIGEGATKELQDLIISYSPGTVFRFGDDRSNLDQELMLSSDMIEIDYSNKRNSTPMPEIHKKKDIIKLVEMIKELSDTSVSVRVPSMDLGKDIDQILVSDIDAIVIDCLPGEDLSSSVQHPVISTILSNDRMGIFRSREKDVRLIVDAPIRNSVDAVKLLALGADQIGLTHITREFIKEMNNSRDWAEIGERFGDHLNSMENGIRELLEKIGNGSLERIRKNGLTASDYSTAAITGLPLVGYGKELPIWRH